MARRNFRPEYLRTGYRMASGEPRRGWTGVNVNEVLDMFGHGEALDIAAGLDFSSNIFCDVVRPMLKCVERNHRGSGR